MDKDQLPLPAVDDADAALQKGALDNDFDSALAAQEEAARGRDLSEFSAPAGPDEDDDGVDTIEAEVPGQKAALEEAARTKREQQNADDVTKPPAKEKKPGEGEPVAEKPADKPAEKPADKPAAGEPFKWTYAADEKVAISPTLEVTRAQLNERLNLTQTALDEANGFRAIFRCDKQTAEKVWKPIIDGIEKDPSRADFLNQCIEACEDPHLRNYVERAIANFQQLDANGQVKRDGTVAAPVTKDPAAQEALRIAQDNQRVLNEQREQQRQAQLQAAQIAVNAEWSELSKEYPTLEDEGWRRFVAQHAYAKLAGDPARGVPADPTYTLTKAAHDLAERYLKPVGAPKETPRAKPAVPSLNGSSGASATVTRRATRNARGKNYESADDAAEAFFEEFPDDGSFR